MICLSDHVIKSKTEELLVNKLINTTIHRHSQKFTIKDKSLSY